MKTTLGSRRAALPALLVFVSLLGFGLPYLPQTLTAANFGTDSGDLLAAILTGGVAHPSGYPTYALLGQLFSRLPISTPYFRVALLSLLPAALAAGLATFWPLSWKPQRLPASFLAAGVVGVAWGGAHLFLSQALIVEVYGLHALFSLLGLGWALLLLQPGERRLSPWLYLGLALAFGVGLGNHLTLLLLAPACLLALLWAWRRGMSWKLALGQALTLSMGCLVYLYLPLAARTNPPINWGNPQTWQGFTWLVGGAAYREYLLSVPQTALLERFAAWFNLLRQQFGLFGLALGASGVSLLGEYEKRQAPLLLWAFFSTSLFAILYQTADSVTYLLPALLVFAIWIAYAVFSLTEFNWKGRPVGIWLGVATLAFFILRFPAALQLADPRSEPEPEAFAQEVLATAPVDALVLTESDADTFALWYHHFGLRERPDLAVISLPLTRFGWYQGTLEKTYPSLDLPPVAQEDLDEWAAAVGELNPLRPLCASRLTGAAPLQITFNCQEGSP